MELFFLQSLLFIILLSLSFYLYFYPTLKKPINKTGFEIYPLLGTIPEFLKNRHQLLDWTTEVLSRCPTNSSAFCRPGTDIGIMTANPLNVEHLLKTNFENYPKGSQFISFLKDFLGQGIFNSDGDLWKVQRKTSSYEFNTKSLTSFVIENVMVEIRTRLVPFLRIAAERKQVLDLQDVLERFAFDNVCKLAFNVDPACLGHNVYPTDFMGAFDDATQNSYERIMHVFPFMWKMKRFFNIGSEQRLKQSITIVHEFVDKIINSRIEEKKMKKDADLLSRFMENHENSPEFLRDICISFILAGRDTTSSALSWFFWILSSRKHIIQNILKELENIRHRSGKKIGDAYSLEELRDMHYLHATISETMRLYPPVPIDTKLCQQEDMMPDKTIVKKGWTVVYHAYAMGRMESIWGNNCREFLPDRWIDENGMFRPESAFRFPVFHAGPRICLGKDMAYIQMKSIVAAVFERFEVNVLEKDKCPEYLLALTLRMKGGLPATVKERYVDQQI